MKTLKESIKELITESYKFNDADEAIDAFKTKKLGVKISPNLLSKNAALIKNIFQKYYEKAQENGINEPTYGLQFIVAHATLPQDLDREINSETLYTYLQNYKKPWIKQLPSYNNFINKPYNSNTWNDFESEIQSNLSKHGKAAKGTGSKKDVKILYPKDENGWELKAAFSWAGAKAASFYGKEGENIPAHWCTRANEEQYKHYSANGKYPLYIIRNYKTGKAYQISIGERSDYYHRDKKLQIDFLDQNDKDGDEITSGDLSKIPDDLLKLIKGVDLFKFKHMESPNYKKTTYKQEIVSNDSIKKFYQKLDDLDDDYEMAYYGGTAKGIKEIYQDLVKKYGPVVKEISKNAFLSEKGFGTNKIYTNYIETGKKENNKIKTGIRIYHFKNLKNESVKIENRQINHEFTEIDPEDAYEGANITKNILALIALLDSNLEVRFRNYRDKITYGNRFDRDEQIQAREKKEKCNKIQKYIDDLISKENDGTEIEKIKMVNSNFPETTAWPSYEVHFKNDGFNIFRHLKGKNTYYNKAFNNIDIDKVTAERLSDIINMANRYARKVFQSEIINSRKEHKYKTNMYEEVNEIVDNIFNY